MNLPLQQVTLLAIDTTGASGSVALGAFAPEPGCPPSVRVLAEAELAGKTYSAQLISSIDEILREAGVILAKVNAIVVVIGPGSFTGVRVGISAAKGLAEASRIPIIALSRLELLARQAAGSACAALDAGRGECYVGLYRSYSPLRELLSTPAEAAIAAHDANLDITCCEEVVASHFAGANLVTPPTAADTLIPGAERYIGGSFDDVGTLDGNYLRRPDAENSGLQTLPTVEPQSND